MERISDKLAAQIRNNRAKEAKIKQVAHFEKQAELLDEVVDEVIEEDQTEPDTIEAPDAPMVQSLSDVKVDEPTYEEGDSGLEALLKSHQ